jgi:hypothetical protein
MFSLAFLSDYNTLLPNINKTTGEKDGTDSCKR